MKSAEGFARLLAQRGPSWLVTLLLAALAIDAGLILTRALGGPANIPPAVSTSASSASRRGIANAAFELATIVNAHLFGAGPLPKSAGNVPRTTMPLVLAGVIARPDPHRGEAILGSSNASAKLYAVGNAIPGGARLDSVYADRVLLERNGHLESLLLPRTPSPVRVSAAPARPPANLYQRMRKNATLLSGLVRVQPVFAGRKLSGYRIFPGGGNGGRAFRMLGLQPGDLVVAVNGSRLDDPGRALQMLQTLSSSGSATLTISRGGQNSQVTLDLAELQNLPPAPSRGPPVRFFSRPARPAGADAQ